MTDHLEVRVRRLELRGPIIDSAAARSAVQISSPRFEATETADVLADAVRAATVRAQSQAAAMAQAVGGTPGRVISLTTLRDGDRDRYTTLVASTVSASDGTEIIAPSIALSITVFGKWELVRR